MYTVETALEFETSAETAFDTLADHDSWPGWMPGSFKPVGASVGTLDVGKVPRVRISGLPFTSPLPVKVAEGRSASAVIVFASVISLRTATFVTFSLLHFFTFST